MARHALVTGGAGFIGSHLVEALLASGYQVTAVDDESTGSAMNLTSARHQAAAAHPPAALRYLPGNAADASLMEEVIAEVDLIFHLAAAVGVGLVSTRSSEAIERIVQPTRVVLRLASERLRRERGNGAGLRLFLASSSEVYGKNPAPFWREADDLHWGPPTCARWAYGVAKALDEFMAMAAVREFGLPVVVGRFFNVIGPRQSGAHGMVVPRFIAAARAGLPLFVHGDGRQERCFADVRDMVRVVIELTNCDRAVGEIVNIGSDQPISIAQLAREVLRLFPDSSSSIEMQSYDAAYGAGFEDVRRRVPDLTKLHQLVPPRPQRSLQQTLLELSRHSRERI